MIFAIHQQIQWLIIWPDRMLLEESLFNRSLIVSFLRSSLWVFDISELIYCHCSCFPLSISIRTSFLQYLDNELICFLEGCLKTYLPNPADTQYSGTCLSIHSKPSSDASNRVKHVIWANARQNLQIDLWEQRRHRSACASAQTDQSLRWSLVSSTASRLSKEG